MPVETPSLFAQVIKDHLELKERNSDLGRHLPIDRYRSDDPFENHPLFKTEEQARIEETLSGEESFSEESSPLAWPTEESFVEAPLVPEVDGPAQDTDESLWARSRDFDWGD